MGKHKGRGVGNNSMGATARLSANGRSMTRGERKLINKMNKREHGTLRAQERTERVRLKATTRADVSKARSKATMATSGAASGGGAAASIGQSLASGGIGESGDTITNVYNYNNGSSDDDSGQGGLGDGRNPGTTREGS